MTEIRAILFDLGDTLLDFEPMDTRALFNQSAISTHAWLAQRNIPLPPIKKYTTKYLRWIRWNYFRAKLTRREFNSHDLLKRFHTRMGLPTDQATLRELSWLWYEPLTRHTKMESDLISTLVLLREADVKLGIISNTFFPGFAHDRHLEILGLLEFFPFRIYSSEVGYRKPDRRIFQAALQRLNIPASQTLFVGDLVKTDIIGAKGAGMRTALKQPWSNPKPHRLADHVIRKISDLLELLPSHE